MEIQNVVMKKIIHPRVILILITRHPPGQPPIPIYTSIICVVVVVVKSYIPTNRPRTGLARPCRPPAVVRI